MVGAFFQIIIATFIVSLISFVGVFTISKRINLTKKVLGILVSFAAGALIAAVFFDLLPEAFDALHNFTFVIVGIVLFFVIEAAIHWHHHDEECHHHKHKEPVVFLNILGDGFHNFLDGVLIAASFLVSPTTGIATTIAIALHEIPQEIGDFAILVRGGLSKKKALTLNFVSALFAIIGGIVAFFFLTSIEGLIPYVISLAAGGLLYIATTDVLPSLHKERDYKQIVLQTLAFIVGVLLLGLILSGGEHSHEIGIDEEHAEEISAGENSLIEEEYTEDLTHEQMHEEGIEHGHG